MFICIRRIVPSQIYSVNLLWFNADYPAYPSTAELWLVRCCANPRQLIVFVKHETQRARLFHWLEGSVWYCMLEDASHNRKSPACTLICVRPQHHRAVGRQLGLCGSLGELRPQVKVKHKGDWQWQGKKEKTSRHLRLDRWPKSIWGDRHVFGIAAERLIWFPMQRR